MCINPLQRDTLDNLTQYRYKYKNDSILYRHCMSPFLDKLVVFLPKKLAPNLITFFH